jgi:hypothetical protein
MWTPDHCGRHGTGFELQYQAQRHRQSELSGIGPEWRQHAAIRSRTHSSDAEVLDDVMSSVPLEISGATAKAYFAEAILKAGK